MGDRAGRLNRRSANMSYPDGATSVRPFAPLALALVKILELLGLIWQLSSRKGHAGDNFKESDRGQVRRDVARDLP
jgi:hypothetical protein